MEPQLTAPFDNERLFDPLGHLTGEGLQALCEGTLDELGRLEAGEHLSFCDLCLERYTRLVDRVASLSAPMRDLVPQMQALMRRRSFRILCNRYVSAVAAVALCFLVCSSGLFGASPLAPAARREQSLTWPQALQATLEEFNDGLNAAVQAFQEAAQDGLDQLAETARPSAADAPAHAALQGPRSARPLAGLFDLSKE